MNTRVFIVDDDPSILELLCALLEGEGYQVQAFDSASAALEAAQRQPPDVAVIDLMMPGMSGRELAETLRQDSGTLDIPILICSAYYGDLRSSMLELGLEGVAYLRKPFHIEEFLELVARMVSGTATPSLPETEEVGLKRTVSAGRSR